MEEITYKTSYTWPRATPDQHEIEKRKNEGKKEGNPRLYISALGDELLWSVETDERRMKSKQSAIASA